MKRIQEIQAHLVVEEIYYQERDNFQPIPPGNEEEQSGAGLYDACLRSGLSGKV